jgi:hypothetical protein
LAADGNDRPFVFEEYQFVSIFILILDAQLFVATVIPDTNFELDGFPAPQWFGRHIPADETVRFYSSVVVFLLRLFFLALGQMVRLFHSRLYSTTFYGKCNNQHTGQCDRLVVIFASLC